MNTRSVTVVSGGGLAVSAAAKEGNRGAEGMEREVERRRRERRLNRILELGLG